MRGNVCKHQVKVLRMLHLDPTEDTIVRCCEPLKGTVNAGLDGMCVVPPLPYISTVTFMGQPFISEWPRVPIDLQTTLLNQAQELVSMASTNETLMQYLHADFNGSYGKLKTMQSDMESGVIHPSQADLVFHIVWDGLGMGLACLKDMLECRGWLSASQSKQCCSYPHP